ncbi:MAG: hypothetical protein ABF876_02620 [Acetobacter aceti]|uniref:Uncharacterized protein n=1 Tax=Acetobacter aceti TaxID=435 RepID=A0A1U9KIK0_ACEAC|nr:hypothetical protein [Acetobacter aceti]AQS85642.1 hypothetical protein A0U92_13635 [Acetobacter aceti]
MPKPRDLTALQIMPPHLSLSDEEKSSIQSDGIRRRRIAILLPGYRAAAMRADGVFERGAQALRLQERLELQDFTGRRISSEPSGYDAAICALGSTPLPCAALPLRACKSHGTHNSPDESIS